MAANPPSNSKSTGNDQKAGDAAPMMLEDKLHAFWQKNRMIVMGLCALVLVAILGNGAWERIQRQRELDVQAAYAAATTPAQLRAFADAHAGHELAALAEVQIADQAYTAGKTADAIAGYDKAITVLKSGPLASRARLGRALAKIQGGRESEGVAELKQIVDNATDFKTVRAEAAYQLASMAIEGGNYADAQKYIEQINQIDAGGGWARRALALQANMPKSASLAAPLSPAAPRNPAGGPNVQVKLPGK